MDKKNLSKGVDLLAKKSLDVAKDKSKSKWKRIIAAIIAIIGGFIVWLSNQSCSVLPETRIETPSGTIIHFSSKVEHQK